MDGDLKETEIFSLGLNKNGVLMARGGFLGLQLFFLAHTLSLVPEAHKKP